MLKTTEKQIGLKNNRELALEQFDQIIKQADENGHNDNVVRARIDGVCEHLNVDKKEFHAMINGRRENRNAVETDI